MEMMMGQNNSKQQTANSQPPANNQQPAHGATITQSHKTPTITTDNDDYKFQLRKASAKLSHASAT
ncbi:GD22833 [Drosophila simulans]|uniref:GD22833 n=1 Tax=Drosophila simulans TaxID=7240 RepID=B4Q849_DROSI|nr:GD22833 [Drosophila simulans]